MYDIPDTLCRDYMKENLKKPLTSYQSSAFESDMLHTVNCFLDNNLNIAETARQLHIHRNTLLYRLDQIDKELMNKYNKFDDMIEEEIKFQELLKDSGE